jgi:hypothetical protein
MASDGLHSPTFPEHALLTCIARHQLGESRTAKLRGLLSCSLDWNYLIDTARTHGLIPLLYRQLSSVAADYPDIPIATLRQESLENCQSVLHLLSRLSEVLAIFKAEQIPVLLFKGPLLSEIAYGENSLRQAGDLDLLIAIKDFDRARCALERLGYQMTPPLTKRQERAHLAFHCEIQFQRDNGFTVVDLHWSLSPKAFPFALRVEEFFERAQAIVIAGQPAYTFDREDLILFQCMHGAKHYWSRLEWIGSLAEIVRRQDVDWPTVIARARATRALKVLALGFYLAKSVGDVAIPENVLRTLDPDGAINQVANHTLESLFNPIEIEHESVMAIRKNFSIMDRKRDVVASLLRAVFVPTLSDWQTISLPTSLHPLYYALRPPRLVKVYAESILRRTHDSAQPLTAMLPRT